MIPKLTQVQGTPNYPCGACKKGVSWSCTRTAVACDSCDTWYHTDCMGMSNDSYDKLHGSDVSWICASCDTRNHSQSLMDSYNEESVNQFEPFFNPPEVVASPSPQHITSGNTSEHSDQDIGPPLQQSSPIKTSRRKNIARPLKVLSVNLQSINAQKEAFWEAISTSRPDVIIANETWLQPDMTSAEMMPPGYNVPNRNERSDGYWGVLLATSSDLIDTILTIDIDCEIATSKIELALQKPLIIMSAYRPPNNDLPYAQRICQAIRNIALKYPSATLWLSGDFNLPDIDWTTDSIKGHQYTLVSNNCFLSTFHNLGL